MNSANSEMKYTKDHEWIKVENGNVGVCGITNHAQEMLTDIVFVELPEVDFDVLQKDQIGVVESVKAVSDVYSPVSGKIIEVNNELEDSPELINSDPHGAGWIFKIELSDLSELDDLMGEDEYKEYADSGE